MLYSLFGRAHEDAVVRKIVSEQYMRCSLDYRLDTTFTAKSSRENSKNTPEKIHDVLTLYDVL